MEIYEILKKVRKDRGFSQQSLAHNITSRESVAKYENGERNIPFIVLMKLLNRLNVTIEEFLFYLDDELVRKEDSEIYAVMQANHKYKMPSKYTLAKFRKKMITTSNVEAIRNYLVIKTSNWSNLLESERILSKQDKKYLAILMDYLEKVEEWGRFEMASFTALLCLFDTSYIRQRISEIERRIDKIKGSEIFSSILASLYHHAFLLMLERKNYQLAGQYLEKFRKIQHKTFVVHTIDLTYRFHHALLLYLKRKGNQEKQQMLSIMKGLELIGDRQWLEECRNILKKYEKIHNITPLFLKDQPV